MKKYYFELTNGHDSKLSGHAYTLAGVKHIFKKVTSAKVCNVYKKGRTMYERTHFITYLK